MQEQNHFIPFGKKFCQAQFESVVWGKIDHWEKSFSPEVKTVIFGLTLAEWISTEQIAFLFSWIRNVKLSGKKVIISLPFRYHIDTYLDKSRLRLLFTDYKSKTGKDFLDTKESIKRRKRSGAFLLAVFGLFNRVGLNEEDFENMTEYSEYFKESTGLLKNNHQIIPFTIFELPEKNRSLKFDAYYQYKISNTDKKNSQNIFELQKNIQDILRYYACYSPFESKILSNVITQELYLNSLQHSFEKETRHQNPECYITAFLSNKWANTNSSLWNESFTTEKYVDTLDFYKDKDRILNELIQSKQPASVSKLEHPDLSQYNYFKNISYLEYTFIDFGQGIANSLGKIFETELKEKKLVNHPNLSKSFETAEKSSQILEYAFLLDTSSNPLDKTIEYYELVPRGLYFLVDMVRRYKGLLIARSGKGRIVYDFSNKIKVINSAGTHVYKISPVTMVKDAVKYSSEPTLANFKGTMFTIILPEKQTQENTDNTIIPPVRADTKLLSDYAYHLEDKNFLLNYHPKEQFYPQSFEYIGILFSYNNIIEELSDSRIEIHTKDIYNKLFDHINQLLNLYQHRNCIVFFDFAGLKTGNALWIKILYLLIITPKINEYCKAVIVNLPSDEDRIITELKQNFIYLEAQGKKIKKKIPEPFLYKPIPCLNFRIDYTQEDELVEWIGLKDKADEMNLTNLLLGRKESYVADKFNTLGNTEGSLFVKSDNRVYSSFSGLERIRKIFYEVQSKAVAKFLKLRVESGFDQQSQKLAHVFLSSNGGYQYEYLSLYEILHDKYLATFFAKCLLDRYCSYIKEKLAAGSDVNDFYFNKILTVTVSSQLIGAALRSLIAEDNNYSFLRQDNIEPAPDLVMLASYYSFDSEKPFDKLNPKDRVIIVNDVISTGRLVKQLIHKIDSVQKIPITAVFSVADTRLPKEMIDQDMELPAEKFDKIEIPFFTLCSYQDGIEIHKYKGPYNGEAIVKRINPLLNTIVELKAEHGEQQKILFSNASDIINDANIDPNYFKIGHFQQNLTHNGYLTDMRPLFASHQGLYLIEKMKEAIERKNKGVIDKITTVNLNVRLANIESQLDLIDEIILNTPYRSNLQEIKSKVENLRQDVAGDIGETGFSHKFSPDFIFYPVLSGIERISHFKLANIFNTHPDNIIGLHRFDTPKGWRFPFPAKRYNQLTKNKTVLILDSGSLTGESLVQLIDNIGFLDVKDIVVLSVVTRVEDFNREFYSRLKSIKVKRLRKKDGKHDVAVPAENIVPINILFGISMHIPVYPSSIACPFCSELNYLNAIGTNTHFVNPPRDVTGYITKRKEDIKLLVVSRDRLSNISYLPLRRQDRMPDIKELFVTRDILGKIDSYRFYPEYFSAFSNLARQLNQNENWIDNNHIKKELELILACILHEPSLFEVINNLVNDLSHYLKQYIVKIVWDRYFLAFYEWKKESIVHLFFIIVPNLVNDLLHFEALLSYADDEAFQYIQFKLWDILYSKKIISEAKNNVEAMLFAFDQKHARKSSSTFSSDQISKIVRILSDYYQFQPLSDDEYLGAAFYNLKKFYLSGKHQARHFVMKGKLLSLINNLTDKQPKIIDIKRDLRDVWNICESNLKPNLERILADPNIPVFHKPMENIFGRTEGGMLYYIDDLGKLEEFFSRISEKDIIMAADKLQKLTKICADLATKVLVETASANFYTLCDEYPCDFFDVLDQYTRKYDWIKLIPHIKPARITDQRIVCHKAIFASIIDEITANATRVYSSELLLHVTYQVTDNSIVLTFDQNKPFVENNRRSGLVNNVKHFTENFGGSYSDNAEQSFITGENFVINLQFLIHKLKKNVNIHES